jgi:hypothetical protein
MEASKNNFDKNILFQLTAEQRKYIYDEEKRRIKQSTPILSKQAKVYIIFYFLGCVLLYFGIAQSLIEFIGTGKWRFQPETSIFNTLLNSIIELIRPFLAVLFITWPILIIYGLWAWGDEKFMNLKKFFRQNK